MLYPTELRGHHDLSRTRTCSLFLRREALYPLSYETNNSGLYGSRTRSPARWTDHPHPHEVETPGVEPGFDTITTAQQVIPEGFEPPTFTFVACCSNPG